jgi:Xaa-Pro aminopeptidase
MAPNTLQSATSDVNGFQGACMRKLAALHLLRGSRFTGSAGVAIVSKTTAYLVTDSRYWLQAQEQVDKNWNVVPAGSVDGPRDWYEFIVDRVKDSRIGIDARMLSHEKAVTLNSQLQAKGSKLFYPPQNLVDLIWREKPPRSKEPVYVLSKNFTGMDAERKLTMLKTWIEEQPPSVPSYSKGPPTPGQMQAGMLISNLACIGE